MKKLITYIDGIESDCVPLVNNRVTDSAYGWFFAMGIEAFGYAIIGVHEALDRGENSGVVRLGTFNGSWKAI